MASNRLTVEFAAPATVYRGSRFDWTGFVTQVTLDGATRFCVPESTDGTGTGGWGLSNEFGILEPVGFEDAQPGEWFPKLGVGLLRRPDAAPCNFARPYEMRPFPMRWEATAETIRLVVDPLPTRGYAVRLTKILTVIDNRLTLDYLLENVGTRAIATREYAHNFLMVDEGRAADYVLRLPFEVDAWPWPAAVQGSGREVRWLNPPQRPIYVPMEPLPPGARTFTLVHQPSGARVSETCDTDWCKLTVWGTGRVISPEAFVALDLAPGARQTWRRTYTFDREPAP